MFLLSKAAITEGMNPHVFVVYRQGFATLALAPFAFFLERGKNSPLLSFTLLCKIALASSGMESLSIKQRHGMAKVVGSSIGLWGALTCTFVSGPPMYSESRKDILHLTKQNYENGDWIKGNPAWCLWFIMQSPLIKQYPSKLRLTALQCLASCVSSAIWQQQKTETWKLGNLDGMIIFFQFFTGLIVTGISYWLQVWVVEKKGPVFTAVFGPLALILNAVFSAVLFQDTSLGKCMWGYSASNWALWGKREESERNENEEKIERRQENV